MFMTTGGEERATKEGGKIYIMLKIINIKSRTYYANLQPLVYISAFIVSYN